MTALAEQVTAQLAEHTITGIGIRESGYRYPRTVGRNARLGSHGSGGTVRLVVLETDSGVTGWGIAAGDTSDLEHLAGRSVADLLDPAVGVVEEAAMPADFALHDLAGRLTGRSFAALVGGGPEAESGVTPVRCYSGAIYFDDLDPAEAPRGIAAVLANCRADHALGYRDFKLKIGRGHRWMDAEAGLRRDIEVTRAVREAYPDARILVDANDGYRVDTFLTYLDAVADCDLFWIEEPFPETREDLRLLRSRLDHLGLSTLIADGESDPDVPALLELAADGLIDVLLMDVVSYGLTPWRRLLPTLRELGVRASPHAWGQPLKTMYAAAMSVGLGDIVTVEGVPGRHEDISGYPLLDGCLQVPDTPGFGLDLAP